MTVTGRVTAIFQVFQFMDIPFSTLFPDWDEKYDIVKILEPDLKRCSEARKKEIGYGEYLGCSNGFVNLGYDYGNADFASRDEAWTGVLKKLSIRLDTYDGDMSKSFFFNLVRNKGTLVSPVSYAFSPQDIYEALKDKYGD